MPFRASSNRRVILLSVLLYLIAMGLLGPLFVYRLFPDSTSYFSIANQYAAGHWAEAVNGYWSPLYSWLLVPFIWAGITPHVATKFLFTMTGVTVVWIFHVFVGRLGVDPRTQSWATITSIPIVAYCSLTMPTPDFLLVGLLLLYFVLLCHPHFAATRWSGVLCGLVGGVAYLSKHYAIAFFAAHFTLLMLAIYLRHRKERAGRRIVLHYVAGMVVFASICSAWIGVMSEKYGRLTVSQAGSYNHALVGPQFSRSHRLRPPPNTHALSAWDNPASEATRPWNPVASLNNLARKLEQMGRTARRIGFTLLGYTVFAPVIVVAGILMWYLPANLIPQVDRDGAQFVLVTMLIYVSGYVTISIFDPRYFWICWFLLLALAAIVLTRMSAAASFTPRLKNIALLLATVSFMAQPAVGVVAEANEGRDLYEISRQLKAMQPINGRLATLDRWRESLYLAYYLDAPYYGRTRPADSPQQLIAELQEHQIDYLLDWRNYKSSAHKNGNQSPPPGREITGGTIEHIRLFTHANGWNGAASSETKQHH